ncbi:transporter substrate-binding domain-containing protein [Zoogloea sp.]|uniref:response regulator n=1 Tax=Zoogloea sp. TaxID=49181 RepID=UPI002624FCF3|nr:transporter substrate-binding domain-containing protein [Zoogloea sp.]MDD3352106.1 transporter substrate-binding domain-containing protein [Zoogloea sp.]
MGRIRLLTSLVLLTLGLPGSPADAQAVDPERLQELTGAAARIPSRQVLKVVSDDNFPPLLFRNEEGEVVGYTADLWALWEKKTGIRVELTATNWANAQRLIQEGQADVIDVIYRTPPRESLYDFSAPYAEMPVAIYRHSSISGIDRIGTLKGFVVGVQKGDACVDFLTGKGLTNLALYTNYTDLIEAARREEIKVFCLDEHPANFYLYKAGAQKDFSKAFALYTGHLRRAVLQGHTDTLQRVEAGFKAISPEEEAALRRKWMGERSMSLERFGVYLGWSALALLAVGALLLAWNLTLRRRVARQTAALNHTLKALQQAHRVTQDVQERQAAILQAIPDLLFEFDQEGRYLNVFAGDEQSLVADREKLIGHRVDDILPDDAARTVQAAVQGALANGHDYGRSICLEMNSQTRWFELSATRKADAPQVLILSRDITQRRVAEQDKHSRALFEAAPIALFHVRDGAIDAVNQRFVELFGYRPEEVRTLEDWWQRAYPDPAYRHQAQALWQSAIAQARKTDGRLEGLEYEICCKNGQRRDIHTGGQLLDDGWIATFSDVTPLKAAESAMKAARDAADAASQAKSSFLANMSHEIRTPMNAILGYTHTLRRSPLAPEQQERLTKIEGASKHLLAILNDVLDISKIESGNLQLEQSVFALSSVMDYVHSLSAEGAAAKGLRMTLDKGGVPEFLKGDATRLRQCLLNYVTNALKFTEQGHIALRARLQEKRGAQILVRFEVEDTGVGIEPADLPKLFQPFRQLDVSTTRRHGGTGLGLAITLRLAGLMGGSAGVDSAPGTGSTFWFTAWLEPAEAAGQAPSAGDQASLQAIFQRHAGRRILLVEDDLVNQAVAIELLTDSGLLIDVANNGREALEQVQQRPYALVLMDMQMPEMGGVEATRKIRELPEHSGIPIIAMTANAFDEDRERCLAAGMNDFISKPVAPEILHATLLHWLDRRDGLPAGHRTHLAPVPDP